MKVQMVDRQSKKYQSSQPDNLRSITTPGHTTPLLLEAESCLVIQRLANFFRLRRR